MLGSSILISTGRVTNGYVSSNRQELKYFLFKKELNAMPGGGGMNV
jgi:hypothetical protein